MGLIIFKRELTNRFKIPYAKSCSELIFHHFMLYNKPCEKIFATVNRQTFPSTHSKKEDFLPEVTKWQHENNIKEHL